MDPNTPNDEDAAMQAGFNSTEDDQSDKGSSSTTVATVTPPAGQQTEEPKEPLESGSSAEAVADPFEGLPPAARKLLAEVPTIQAALAATEDRARRAEGQVRSMQGRFDSLVAAAPPPAHKLDKLQHARDTLGHDMPEVVDALDELAALLPPAQSAPPVVTAPTPPAQAPAQSAAPAINPHMQALDQVRPDWFDTLDSTDCKLWVTTQSPEIQAAYRRAESAGDVLQVLGAFDKHVQHKQTASLQAASRESRVAAAVVPTGNAKAPGARRALSEAEAMEQGFKS